MERTLMKLVAAVAALARAPRLALAGLLALLPCAASADVPAPGTTAPRTIWSGGEERQYLLHVPTPYDGRKPLPLVFVLHGFGGNGAGMEVDTGLSAKADEEGFFVAYLNGMPCVPSPENSGSCTGTQRGWNSGLSPALGITTDDVRFVRDLLRSLQDQLRVDVRRVYAAGFSNGAFMSHRLAAELSDLLAAVAVVEGTIGTRQPDGAFAVIPEPAGSIPMAIVHGIEDTSVLYYGGVGSSAGHIDALPVSAAVAFWTAANRCHGDPETETSFGGELVTTRYPGCEANSDVVLFTLTHGQHRWPTVQSPGVPGTDFIWEFFSRHPRT